MRRIRFPDVKREAVSVRYLENGMVEVQPGLLSMDALHMQFEMWYDELRFEEELEDLAEALRGGVQYEVHLEELQ